MFDTTTLPIVFFITAITIALIGCISICVITVYTANKAEKIAKTIANRQKNETAQLAADILIEKVGRK